MPSPATSSHTVQRIVIPEQLDAVAVCGQRDGVLRTIEQCFAGVDVTGKGNIITVRGPQEAVNLAADLLHELLDLVREGTAVDVDVVRRSAQMLSASVPQRPSEVLTTHIISSRGRIIRPKTVGQKRYVDAIDANTITFGIGPAGTGKTYLAMAKAVQALQEHRVGRIILSRPAVEAGEKLGFLPGSLSEKIDPYLRPLFDALQEMVDPATIPRLMESGTIEVAPLAFLRGRSLNDSFIILDEAQNTTSEQMKMFLTRLGFGSTMVVTGDSTQIDLPGSVTSGLRIVQDVLTGVDDVEFCQLTSSDVVRHRLVSDIIDAYARWDTRGPATGPISHRQSRDFAKMGTL